MLGQPTTKFMRNIFSKQETLFYSEIGVYMGFDKNLKLESMEFVELENAKPANLILFNKELFNLSFEDLLKLFKENDNSTTLDAEGFTSPKLGIAVYDPDIETDRLSPAHGILVYRDIDYYEQEE